MDRYQAKLDQIPLDCETLDDTWTKAIARADIPYLDGPKTEDMGLKDRVIRLRCYFLGEDYQRHNDLLGYLARRDLFELTHPKYGIVKGRIETVAVHHDDRVATAEIDISFVAEATNGGGVVPLVEIDRRGAAEESFVDGQDEAMSQYADDVRAALGMEAEVVLAAELDPDLPVVDQIVGISRAARNYLKQVDAWTGDLAGTLSDVANPASSLLNAINYPNTLAGRVVGTIARTVERYVETLSGFRSAPFRFLSGLSLGLAALRSSAGFYDPAPLPGRTMPTFATPTRIAGAQRMAMETSLIMADDEQARQSARSSAAADSFDALGNYLAPEPAPEVMTDQELEQGLAVARTELQAAIDVARSVTTLKTQASQLKQQAATMKAGRARVVEVDLDNPMPLHLVCLRYGLPYNDAERLLVINDIPAPSRTGGTVKVYA
ncbi:MAG: DNA circularization N-terminal domain-containing protein [Desulfobulbaceae bacterium]|nr:DNA circularization N-terminal domain-containing protein [Desulfobulbaceae bacterium]